MTLKKLIYWFFSTLVLGGVTAIFFGFLIEAAVGQNIFGPLTGQLLLSLSLAAVAELGFFSYLIFNWLSRGLVRNKTAYEVILLALMILLLGNLVYLNMAKYSGATLGIHLLIPLIVLVIGGVVAWLKAKWTNRSGFIPTLFFMVVATILEAIPSINPKAGEVPILIIFQTVLVLLVCNAWQILQLHRWVQKPNKKS